MSKQYDEAFSTSNFHFDNCEMSERNFLSEIKLMGLVQFVIWRAWNSSLFFIFLQALLSQTLMSQTRDNFCQNSRFVCFYLKTSQVLPSSAFNSSLVLYMHDRSKKINLLKLSMRVTVCKQEKHKLKYLQGIWLEKGFGHFIKKLMCSRWCGKV